MRIGKLIGDGVVDLAPVMAGDSMRALLARWAECRDAVTALRGPVVPLERVQLEAPVHDPQKFLAIGMNYRAHADEARDLGVAVPSSQLWFNKQVSCVNGPYQPIELPRVSEQLDYEGELGVVIGRRCRHVSPGEALDVVAGYVICNDVSVRDWQKRTPTFTLGKSFDTHGPIGPWLTTVDEVADPQALELRTLLNGEVVQQASTSEMIYKIADQIAYLSIVMTLEPGDVLATGTPAGVGVARGRFLRAGDVVRVEISGLGHIENKVVPEP